MQLSVFEYNSFDYIGGKRTAYRQEYRYLAEKSSK
jgi:hypothetical protein